MSFARELDQRLSEFEQKLSEVAERQRALEKEVKALRGDLAKSQAKKQAPQVPAHKHAEYADVKLVNELSEAQKRVADRLAQVEHAVREFGGKLEALGRAVGQVPPHDHDDLMEQAKMLVGMAVDELQEQIASLGSGLGELEDQQKRLGQQVNRVVQILARRGLVKVAKR